MFNKEKHQLIMGRILQDIYSDTSISSLLGFKGGTCAYFFYGLTRFSADLDFDLLKDDETVQKLVYEKIGSMLGAYGDIKDRYMKRHTIFFLLSYGAADRNIKIEVNIRILAQNISEHYEIKEYLGISMLVAKKDYLFASKLAALTGRKSVAMRDIYDIWFFATNNWNINIDVLKARISKTIKEYFTDCIRIIESVKDDEILHGLAEFLQGEKEKIWVRKNLRKETILLLKNYISVLSNR